MTAINCLINDYRFHLRTEMGIGKHKNITTQNVHKHVLHIQMYCEMFIFTLIKTHFSCWRLKENTNWFGLKIFKPRLFDISILQLVCSIQLKLILLISNWSQFCGSLFKSLLIFPVFIYIFSLFFIYYIDSHIIRYFR